MRKIIILLLIVSSSINCKNRDNTEFIKASYEVNNENSEFDKIVAEFRTELASINKKYNINNRKEILNIILQEKDFFSSDKIKSTQQKLDEAKNYFENIFRENDAIYENSLKKLNLLNDKTKSKEVTEKCTIAISYIITLQMNSQMYKIEVDKLMDLIGSSSKYVGKDCKYIIKNDEVLFYEEDCLNKYNKLVEEVQKSQISCNNYRQKINDLKI